jgi:pimeloyl-ACP methyl ester carboxylesterase
MTTPRIEDVFADVPAGRTFVRRWRPALPAAGVPLVLLHDSLGSVEQWRDFPTRLAARLRCDVIAYDRPGFGQSTPRHQPPSLDFIAEEARNHFPALRTALGLGEFGLLGHSVGGAIAAVVAATQGDSCRFLITESAQAFVEARTLEGIRTAKAQFADAAQFSRLARWHGERARWVLEAWTEVWLDPRFAGWSLDAWLPQVRCPVLAIHGDGDEYGSVAFPARIVHGVSAPAQLAVLAGCGHVPHRERPDEVLGLVADFVAASASQG